MVKHFLTGWLSIVLFSTFSQEKAQPLPLDISQVAETVFIR